MNHYANHNSLNHLRYEDNDGYRTTKPARLISTATRENLVPQLQVKQMSMSNVNVKSKFI